MIPISLFKTENLKSIPDSEIFKIITSSGTSGVASHLYLDAFNAQNQQLALYNIVKDFIGSSRLPMLIVDTPEILKIGMPLMPAVQPSWAFPSLPNENTMP